VKQEICKFTEIFRKFVNLLGEQIYCNMCSKPGQGDLLSLDLMGGETSSSASTPTAANYTLPSPISPLASTTIDWLLGAKKPTTLPQGAQSSPGSKTFILPSTFFMIIIIIIIIMVIVVVAGVVVVAAAVVATAAAVLFIV
jgi:hypothetical protein